MNRTLITKNPEVESEFRKIAAVTGAKLQILPQLPLGEVRAHTIFYLDHDLVDEFDLHTMQKIREQHSVSTVVVVATSPNGNTWRLAQQVNATNVVVIPDSRQWIVESMKAPSNVDGKVISLSSVIGGSGTSTLAIAMASVLSKQKAKVALIDCDSNAVGFDVACGLDQTPGIRWSTIHQHKVRPEAEALLDNLPKRDTISVLAIDELWRETDIDDLEFVVSKLKEVNDFVILDLPLISRIQLNEQVKEFIDNSVFVMTNSLRACAVAHKAVTIFQQPFPTVIRELPGSALSPLSIAQSLQVNLWSTLPTDSRVVEFVEQGLAFETTNVTKYNRAVTGLVNRFMNDFELLHAA